MIGKGVWTGTTWLGASDRDWGGKGQGQGLGEAGACLPYREPLRLIIAQGWTFIL